PAVRLRAQRRPGPAPDRRAAPAARRPARHVGRGRRRARPGPGPARPGAAPPRARPPRRRLGTDRPLHAVTSPPLPSRAMSQTYSASTSVDIAASTDAVWRALTDPALIAKYMHGTTVETDWVEGSPIIWRGEWQGREYEDKGEVLTVDPQYRLAV